MNIIAFPEPNNNDSDYIIEGNHARMSQRKVAEIIGIVSSSVTKWCASHLDVLEAEKIRERGFDGASLNKIVGYYATSKSVKQEVRDNCVNLLIQSSQIGFQALIDKKSWDTSPVLLGRLFLQYTIFLLY